MSLLRRIHPKKSYLLPVLRERSLKNFGEAAFKTSYHAGAGDADRQCSIPNQAAMSTINKTRRRVGFLGMDILI
jgi:hypothetical protein